MEWEDDPPRELPEELAETKYPVISETRHSDIIRSIENELHMITAEVVHGVLSFADLDPENLPTDPPQEWVEQMGLARARKRFTLAKAGWMNAKEAPIAIKVATQTFAGIVKARATERVAPRALNIQIVEMSAPVPLFPELEVEK